MAKKKTPVPVPKEAAIAAAAMAEPPMPKPEPAPVKVAPPIEKVFKVRFNGKLTPDDNDDIFLCVNGVSLVVKRNVTIPLPERFLTAAENASEKLYTFDSEGTVIHTDELQRFPFSILGETTWAEFRAHMTAKKESQMNK